jgi:hypothetical protein
VGIETMNIIRWLSIFSAAGWTSTRGLPGDEMTHKKV